MLSGYRLGDDDGQYAAFTDLLSSRFIPWNYYTFKGMEDTGSRGSGLLLSHSAVASEANAKSLRLDAMVVPYPQLVAGTPKEWSFDRGTRVARFVYSTRPVGPSVPCADAATEIFIPARHYPQGYTAEVKGGKVVSSPSSAWLVLEQLDGAQEVLVTIRPRNGSYTERPATALGPTANVSCK